jgi:uncharacterized protein YjbI with pentapeptide repeats
MAIKKHLEIFKQGVSQWNQWREMDAATLPNLEGADLSELSLQKINLRGVKLRRANLSRSDLSNAVLDLSDLYKCDLHSANLSEASLNKANLYEADLRSANLYKANLQGANLSKADLSEAHLNGTELQSALLREALLREVQLQDANFDGMNLTGADLSGADLAKASLRGANLRRAKLNETILTEANLSNADLQEAELYRVEFQRADLIGTNFSRAQMPHAQLHDARLAEAELISANLTEANLHGADLHGVKMQDADLSAADLSETNLREADLRKTCCRLANLTRANLRGTNLSGADLSGAILHESNLIRAILDNAKITGAKLWEIQRAGWSIREIICDTLYWDQNQQERVVYASGEFERLYGDKTRILLHYRGGISPIEVATLPVLIQQLESRFANCILRLEAIQDAPGGATVTIAVDDIGDHDPIVLSEKLQQQSQQLQGALKQISELKDIRHMIEQMIDEHLPRLIEPYRDYREKETLSESNNEDAVSNEFDAFLCHNTEDKVVVKEIAEQLRERGLAPWLDEWELVPGQSWQEKLEENIGRIRSVAVFLGKGGSTPWGDQEIAEILSKFIQRGRRIVPVILPDCNKVPKLPIFLQGISTVDFRKADSAPLDRLIWSITGIRPNTR